MSLPFGWVIKNGKRRMGWKYESNIIISKAEKKKVGKKLTRGQG